MRVTYRHLIFDFDGTLADSFSWFVSIMDEVADHFGLERLPKEKIDGLRSWSARDLIRSSKIPLWKIPFIARHVKRMMAEDIAKIELFEGTREMLSELASRGVRLSIASSNTRENVEAVLGPEHARLFEHYECGVSLFGKSSRYRKIHRRAGIAETLCIGDELRDLDAARKCGLPFGAVSWGFTHGSALAAGGPEHYFGAIQEIIDLAPPQLRESLHTHG